MVSLVYSLPIVIGVNMARRSPECAAYVFPANCPECSTAVVQIEDEVALSLGVREQRLGGAANGV